MDLKIKRKTAYWIIIFFVINLLFSLLEIVNLASLYKDQIEMSVTILQENVSADYVWDLLEQAKKLTNWINFFQYSAVTSIFSIIVLSVRILKFK